MKINLEKLIDNNGKNSLIVDMLQTKKLTIVGYPTVRIELQESQYKNTLIDVEVADEFGKRYKIYKLKSETITSLPLYSTISNKSITYNGINEIFNINTNETTTSKLDNSNLPKNIIDEIISKISKSEYQNFTFVKAKNNKTLIIPNILIGNFFYFPNTYIKRAFISQDIGCNIHTSLSSCKGAKICLKSNIKYEHTTIALSYFYMCNKEAYENFNKSYYLNIRNRIKEATDKEKKQGFIFITPIFKFPIADRIDLELRGEYLDDNHFIVYQINDINFKDILGIDTIEAFYENRETTKRHYLNNFPLGVTRNNNLSHNTKTNPNTRHNDITVFIKNQSDTHIEQININKIENISRGEYKYSQPYEDEDNQLQGNSLGDLEDNESNFAKSSYSELKFNFDKVVSILEQKLNINDKNYYSNKQYYALKFNYQNRQYFILELKEYNSSTLLFSSHKAFNCNNIAKEVIKMKESISSINNYSKLGYKLYKNQDICFHTPQKHTGDSIESWVDRFIEKIQNYNKCKGLY